MQIQLADIEKIFNMLLTILNRLHVDTVDIRIDYYWSTNGEDAYSSANQKPECGIGSLVDDWECLKKVLDEQNPRTLLLSRKQIDQIAGAISRKGLTAVALKLYFSDKNYVKLEIGVAKHKTLIDKREKIKDREMDREMKREIKNRVG